MTMPLTSKEAEACGVVEFTSHKMKLYLYGRLSSVSEKPAGQRGPWYPLN